MAASASSSRELPRPLCHTHPLLIIMHSLPFEGFRHQIIGFFLNGYFNWKSNGLTSFTFFGIFWLTWLQNGLGKSNDFSMRPSVKFIFPHIDQICFAKKDQTLGRWVPLPFTLVSYTDSKGVNVSNKSVLAGGPVFKSPSSPASLIQFNPVQASCSRPACPATVWLPSGPLQRQPLPVWQLHIVTNFTNLPLPNIVTSLISTSQSCCAKIDQHN